MQALNILNYCKYIEAPIYNTECTNEKGSCSTESQNHQGWETPPGASIPATNPAPPQSPSFPNATSRIIIPTTLPQQKGQFLTSNKINPTKILLLSLHKKLGLVWNKLDLMFHGAWGCHTADCSGTKQRSGNGNPNLWSSLGLMQTTWALTWGWGQLYLMKCKGLSSMLKNTDSGNCFFINPCLNSLSVILVT